MGLQPSTVSFIYLIRACAKSKDVDTAEKLFDAALATCGDNLLGSLYSTLISVHAVKGNVDYIDALMQEKRRKGYDLTVVDYTCKMHGLLIAKNPKAVIALYQDLKNQITPDEFLMTTVLKACASNSEAELALTIWEDIKEFSPLDSCTPYNELIMALGKRKEYAERAMDVWREMRGSGIVPDHRTYNAVLTACTRLGDLILAKEIITDMKMNLISMDSVRYCLLIQVYGEATLRADETKRNICIKDCWELFHQYENSGGKVDAMILNSLLGVHIKALREHEVEGMILPMFDTYNVQKTLHTYRHLIVFYKNLRNPVQVYQIWETMKTEGITPDFYVMNAYLETAYRFNDSDKVVESLQALKKQNGMPLYYIMKRLNSQKDLPRRVWVELQEFKHFYSSIVQSKFGLGYIPDDVRERASR